MIGCWRDIRDDVTLEKNRGLRHRFESLLCTEVRGGVSASQSLWLKSLGSRGLWHTAEAAGDLWWLNSSSRKASHVSSTALSDTFPKRLCPTIMPQTAGATAPSMRTIDLGCPWEWLRSSWEQVQSTDQILGVRVVKSTLETRLALVVLKKRDLLPLFRSQEISQNDLNLCLFLKVWGLDNAGPLCPRHHHVGLAAAGSLGGACALQSPLPPLTLGSPLFNDTCLLSMLEPLVQTKKSRGKTLGNSCSPNRKKKTLQRKKEKKSKTERIYIPLRQHLLYCMAYWEDSVSKESSNLMPFGWWKSSLHPTLYQNNHYF